MRICYVITKADEIGGAQVHVRDLAISMKDRGHEVSIIVGEDGALVSQLHMNGINVVIDKNLQRSINPISDFISFFTLLRKIKSINPDLIALHSSKAGVIGRLVGKALNIPTVFTVHGWAFADGVSNKKKKIYILIERFFARFFTDKLITVSEQDKCLALKYNVAKSDMMVAIQNGVTDNYSSCDLTRNYGSKCLRMIMVARFSEQKDHATLFHALKNVDKSKWKLSLVGKGRLLEEYKVLAKELNISANIEFLGERDDVAKLLLEHDLFLLISNWEGYPISILEAMSSGLPCIVSDVGGVSEAVVDGYTGYLIPRGDVQYLTDKINAVCSDRNSLHEMSKNARKEFCSRHDIKKMVCDTYKVYCGVI